MFFVSARRYRVTSLHIVVAFARGCYMTHNSADVYDAVRPVLPELVQLVVNTGGYIHDRDEKNDTPLTALVADVSFFVLYFKETFFIVSLD